MLALLLETVRDPQRFRAQLQRAAEADIPVVALKVGRTEGSKAMVTAHSGALAGEHGAYEAVFDAYGVHEVLTLDEMADAMELFSAHAGYAAGAGIACVHDSGGERRCSWTWPTTSACRSPRSPSRRVRRSRTRWTRA